jgi:hypothetical protein
MHLGELVAAPRHALPFRRQLDRHRPIVVHDAFARQQAWLCSAGAADATGRIARCRSARRACRRESRGCAGGRSGLLHPGRDEVQYGFFHIDQLATFPIVAALQSRRGAARWRNQINLLSFQRLLLIICAENSASTAERICLRGPSERPAEAIPVPPCSRLRRGAARAERHHDGTGDRDILRPHLHPPVINACASIPNEIAVRARRETHAILRRPSLSRHRSPSAPTRPWSWRPAAVAPAAGRAIR